MESQALFSMKNIYGLKFSYERSAQLMIYVKCQALFSQEKKKKKQKIVCYYHDWCYNIGMNITFEDLTNG